MYLVLGVQVGKLIDFQVLNIHNTVKLRNKVVNLLILRYLTTLISRNAISRFSFG